MLQIINNYYNNNVILLLQAIFTKFRTYLSLQDITYINLFSLLRKVKFGKLRVILLFMITLHTAMLGHIVDLVIFAMF